MTFLFLNMKTRINLCYVLLPKLIVNSNLHFTVRRPQELCFGGFEEFVNPCYAEHPYDKLQRGILCSFNFKQLFELNAYYDLLNQ